jgi:putative membrane protein
MDTWQILTTTWNWDLSILLGCASLVGGYLAFSEFRPPSGWPYFIAGVLVLLVALVSPLHGLGEVYLFSAHMFQHLLLMLVVPPLLLLGLPAKSLRRLFRWPWMHRLERVLAWPLIAWVLGMGAMWLWHLPAFYELTLENHNIHILEHLCFLVTSTIFWWPIFALPKERRLAPFPSLFYLFTAMASSIVLGIILTFAPPGLYPGYLHPVDRLGILPILREQWGLSLALDQKLGGLFMWVLAGLGYVIGALVVFARWFSEMERENLSEITQRNLLLTGTGVAPKEKI